MNFLIHKFLVFSNRTFEAILRKLKITILLYWDFERTDVINLIDRIKKEIHFGQTTDEAYRLYMLVKNTEKIKGDIAEVGVYQGGSAKLICEARKERRLLLFDTFEGLPEKGKFGIYFKGQYSASLDKVKDYLRKYTNIYFYKGVFPQTAIESRFSFVHIDVDIYKSTLDCLTFFYPRMNYGGVILVHDYNKTTDVKSAVDGFFKDKPEPIVELSNSQCLIVKCSR